MIGGPGLKNQCMCYVVNQMKYWKRLYRGLCSICEKSQSASDMDGDSHKVTRQPNMVWQP